MWIRDVNLESRVLHAFGYLRWLINSSLLQNLIEKVFLLKLINLFFKKSRFPHIRVEEARRLRISREHMSLYKLIITLYLINKYLNSSLLFHINTIELYVEEWLSLFRNIDFITILKKYKSLLRLFLWLDVRLL